MGDFRTETIVNDNFNVASIFFFKLACINKLTFGILSTSETTKTDYLLLILSSGCSVHAGHITNKQLHPPCSCIYEKKKIKTH